jgi:hypothetical protein
MGEVFGDEPVLEKNLFQFSKFFSIFSGSSFKNKNIVY